MKKEQGHTGGVAVLADQETPISLLRDIKRLLSLQQATDMPADGEEYRDYAIVAGAGDLYIDTDVQFGYAYIPNCPRDITIYSGTRGGLIGSFKTGAFVQFRMPRSTGVTITYGAGSAAQTLTVYLSAREVSVSPGSFLVDPGTAASSLGKAEDAAHKSGDVGVMALGVRNDLGTTIFANTDLDYTPIATTRSGFVLSAIASQTPASDGLANGAAAVNDTANVGLRSLSVAPSLFNGTTHDRQRSNVEGTALASAARTASTPGPMITNYNGRGVMVYLSVTVASGTGGLTVRFVSNDPTSGLGIYLNTAPTAIVATGIYGYELYPGAGTPGAAGTTNVQQRTQAILPRTFYILVSHGDGSSYTYSVGYSIIN